MIYDQQNIDFSPVIKNTNFRGLHIITIEALTGLTNIESAFENRINETDVELLVSFLDRKYNLSEGEDDVYEYIKNVINFPDKSLEYINANYPEFYDGLTVKEACEIILTKLIDNSNNIPEYGGFPSDFNYEPSQANTVQRMPNGGKWYPYVKGRYELHYDQLLTRVMQTIKTDNNRLYFHGCSWASAILINDFIEIRERDEATDFGMRNFYLTNFFSTAYVWAQRNNQPAVVIFAIPDYIIDDDENKLEFTLSNINDWRQLVFKCRNRPTYGNNLRQRRQEYSNFITNVDSKSLITGPICANPSVTNINDIRYVKYGVDQIPFQYSFKDLLIDKLNDLIAITLFLQEV